MSTESLSHIFVGVELSLISAKLNTSYGIQVDPHLSEAEESVVV